MYAGSNRKILIDHKISFRYAAAESDPGWFPNRD
jgi:hypothetical protein